LARRMGVAVLEDRPSAGVDMDRSRIGMSSRYPTALHLLLRARGSHGLRDDVIAVAGMHRGVAIAVKDDGRDGRAVTRSGQNNAGPRRGRQLTLLHGEERGGKVVG